jgi:hypothetical protein
MPTNAKIDDIYPNRYLKCDDLGEGEPIYTIKDVTDEIIGEKKERKFVLEFQESPKVLILNKTNCGVLSDLYGKSPNGWISKKIQLLAEPVSFQGKTTMGNIVRIERK